MPWSSIKAQSNEDESWRELQLSLTFDRQLSSTLIDFELVQILMRVCARLTSHESCETATGLHFVVAGSAK